MSDAPSQSGEQPPDAAGSGVNDLTAGTDRPEGVPAASWDRAGDAVENREEGRRWRSDGSRHQGCAFGEMLGSCSASTYLHPGDSPSPPMR